MPLFLDLDHTLYLFSLRLNSHYIKTVISKSKIHVFDDVVHTVFIALPPPPPH